MVVTHDMPLCHAVSDRVALLRGGRFVLEVGSEELAELDHPELREFLEGSGDPTAPAISGLQGSGAPPAP